MGVEEEEEDHSYNPIKAASKGKNIKNILGGIDEDEDDEPFMLPG